MNTLLAAWVSYTLGSAPVVLFDGRVPEHGWEICSTSQAPIAVYDGARERSAVGLGLESGMVQGGATALGRVII